MPSVNPFLNLTYEPAIEDLGTDFYAIVKAASFPQHILRWRNNDVLPVIGLEPDRVKDDDVIEAFGHFKSVRPLLALAYHGYQFGTYNPQLGDGRGFLCGQTRGKDGELYDFGTKGSGTTPFSRTADGRLTLKGGIREVLAAEILHRLGVKTSRCLSLIETGEDLWRGDEPSPTRSSVMVRFSSSHIRFGSFERLSYLRRPDLIQQLLDHVIAVYYPHLHQKEDKNILFYDELVKRVATLCAHWMTSGFCHAVLNTDNMSITGESFDYGPFAFIPTYEPRFTAAYFDYSGRYSYENQPGICHWNLEMLQVPLGDVTDRGLMKVALAQFKDHYIFAYEQRLQQRLGLELSENEGREQMIRATIQLLYATQWGYNEFFRDLRLQFDPLWLTTPDRILVGKEQTLEQNQLTLLLQWRVLYHRALSIQSSVKDITDRLKKWNPTKILLRDEIERVWAAITETNDWQPFDQLVKDIQSP